MFGKKNKTAPDTPLSYTAIPTNPSEQTSVICSGTVIEGKIISAQSIRNDGKIVGVLDCQNRLVVGKNGHIDGKVQCKNATIEGFVKGSLTANESLALSGSAHIEGDLQATKLSVESGAVYKGQLNIGTPK
jgi:cytoskeletal protein CcmA (bactofilin family)